MGDLALLKNSRFLRPPLKWAGGKRWLAPHLRPIWERHSQRRLVEPLCGSLAVSLTLRPEKALLNDTNVHLINFYRWIQSGLEVAVEMENDSDLYYRQRGRFNELILSEDGAKSAEAASMFYYLNRTGYNGLCRFNRKGLFNVPFGSYKKINYRRDFSAYQRIFSSWEFRCTAVDSLPVEPDDFIYADPPYDVEFTNYTKDGFDWDDQVWLAEWLAKHPGPVALSNQATKRVVDLYEHLGFNLTYLRAPRRISCTGDRTPAVEVLALKNV